MYELENQTRRGEWALIRVPDEAPMVPIAGGARLPRQFEVMTRPEAEGPLHTATFAVIDGRPKCIGAGAFMWRPEDREIQTTDLRAVRIGDMLDHAAEALTARDEPFGWTTGPDVRGTAQRTVRNARRRVNDDLLRQVAAIYEANLDGAPVAEVEAEFGVSRRTASLYVKKARDAGYIARMKRDGEVF